MCVDGQESSLAHGDLGSCSVLGYDYEHTIHVTSFPLCMTIALLRQVVERHGTLRLWTLVSARRARKK